MQEDLPSESIHPGVETLLKQLEAGDCITPASRGTYEGIQTGRHYSPLGEDASGAWKGNHINRSIFDAELLSIVERRGVEIVKSDAVDPVIEKEKVKGLLLSNATEISSSYIIDASGYRSFGGRKMGFKKKFFSPPLITWTGISGYNNHDQYKARFYPESGGWTWISPEKNGRCTWTRLALIGTQDLLPPAELRHSPLIGKIKTSNRRWQIFRPVCKEGFLLCGDAAGILDPAAGQGILNALLSGITAANTLHAINKDPAHEAFHLATYDDWFLRNYMDKVEKLRKFYAQHGIGWRGEGEVKGKG